MPPAPEQKPQAEQPSQPKPAARPKAVEAHGRPVGAAESSGIAGQFRDWIREEGAWWAASFVFHTLLMAVLMLIPHTVSQPQEGEAPAFENANVDDLKQQQTPIERFEVGETKSEDTELTTESLTMTRAPDIKASDAPDLKGLSADGGGLKAAASSGPVVGGLSGGFTIVGLGAGSARKGSGGIGFSGASGASSSAAGPGYGVRNTLKKTLGAQGGTKDADRAVGAALSWIARHQSRDGSWGLSEYRRQCKDPTCSGPGTYSPGAAAGTAMALLPFFAAGQTHETKGPYRKTIYDGLYYLMRNQSRTGDLSGGKPPAMYVHGLATITLCEAYGLTHSRMIGKSAQQAVLFIQQAQNQATGGWRYTPGEAGDTSVVGWQVMALKSAQMAGLQVNPGSLEGAKRFLKSCSKGKGGQFCYTPEAGPTPTMTAVGLLCLQYGGLKRTDPALADGVTVLMSNLPDKSGRNIYYWYYATQVMHNVSGSDWDNWNRRMRRVLRESQCTKGCSTGSWDPDKPSRDAWADAGGRLMITALSALTLEVYYRYLPLYKLDNTDSTGTLVAAPPPPPPPPPGAPAKSTTPAPKPGGAPAKAAAPATPAPPAAKPATPAPPAAKPATPAPASPPAKK